MNEISGQEKIMCKKRIVLKLKNYPIGSATFSMCIKHLRAELFISGNGTTDAVGVQVDADPAQPVGHLPVNQEQEQEREPGSRALHIHSKTFN